MSSDVGGVSASTMTTTTAKCHSHILKIQGYSQTKLLADGLSWQSQVFKAGGVAWRIVVYPNGISRAAAADDRICFALNFADNFDDGYVSAHARFTLIPHHGRSAPATTHCSSFRWTYRERYDNYRAPPSPLISRAELQGSDEYPLDDGFAVRCDVTVVYEGVRRDKVVQSSDLERAGIACSCKDQLCKRRHASSWAPSETTTLRRRLRRRVKAAWTWLQRRTLP